MWFPSVLRHPLYIYIYFFLQSILLFMSFFFFNWGTWYSKIRTKPPLSLTPIQYTGFREQTVSPHYLENESPLYFKNSLRMKVTFFFFFGPVWNFMVYISYPLIIFCMIKNLQSSMAPKRLPVINNFHLLNHKTGLNCWSIRANCLPDLIGINGGQVIKRCGPSLSYCGTMGSVAYLMFICLVLNYVIATVILKDDKNLPLASWSMEWCL